MRKFIGYLTILMFSFALIHPVQAKNIKKVAQTGFQFLSVDMGARPAAMGGAFIMAGNGADAMFYNPAGMNGMDTKFDVFATRTNWIANIGLSAAAVALNMGNWGNFGLNVISADYGQSIGTRVSDNTAGFVETGDLKIGAYAVGLSYSRALSTQFVVGGQVKYAHEQLGENLMPGGDTVTNQTGGVAFDFGTIYYPGFKSFRFGMSIRNFSPQVKYQEETFEMPLTFRIGVAMDVLDLIGGVPNNSFLISIDALHPRSYTERLQVGGEYWFRDLIALRGGYKMNYDEEGLNLGFGLKYDIGGVNLRVDYSYSQLGTFNNVNRFTVGGAF